MPFPTHVDTGKAPTPITGLAPALLWPSTVVYSRDGTSSTDLTRFPDPHAIGARRSDRNPAPLRAFLAAVQNAVIRVLVLDPYLFKPEDAPEDARSAPTAEDRLRRRLDGILEWFPERRFAATDVRLLAGQVSRDASRRIFAELSARAARINGSNRSRRKQLELLAKATLDGGYPHLHDRFAVVDDELWHFGSTVGGFHRGLTAASRGWPAQATRAVDFFEEVWRHHQDPKPRHDQGGKRR